MSNVKLSAGLRMSARVLLALCALFCGLCRPPCGLAEEAEGLRHGFQGKVFEDSPQGSWTIDAAKIGYDQKRKVYEAEGNVRITSGDRVVEADWAELDTVSRQAELKGHVLLKYHKDWIKGEHVVWNLDKETGSVDGGLIFFAENNFHVSGEHISKTGPREYELQEGFVTSCDPDNADWKFHYKSMTVDLDGNAVARDTSFWVRDVPLLYSPILALPVQQERQSGFLIPWGGASDLNGIEGELPYYWAIGKDMDATFYGRFMSKRGWMTGGEYRVANEKWGQGIWAINYLDDQASKGHLEAEDYPFQTDDRYWLRAKHSLDLPYNIEARLDLDMVSDRNYLKEFEKGSTSLDFSDGMFRDFLGRGILNDETITARESALYVDKRGESTLLSLDVRYWDQTDEDIDDVTLQRLPALSFNVIPTRIDGYPLYYTLESSWVDFWRRDGDRGNRLDAFPRLYYPMHWKNYLDFEPSVGLRTTTYAVDWDERSRDPWQTRLISDARLGMSSRLNRVYDLKLWDFVALEHAIRPEIIYEYAENSVEDHIPLFDRLDEDQGRHDVRAGFTSFLTGKQILEDPDGNPVNSYRELARVEVFQAYNMEPPLPDDRFDPFPEKGFSNFGLKLDVTPKKYVTLSYDADFSLEELGVTQHDLFVTFDSSKGHTFRLDYRYRKDDIVEDISVINEIIPRMDVKVLPNVFLTTYHDYSIDQNDLFSHGYGVKYIHGCWGIGLAYEQEASDQRVAFSVNLLGLGWFGGSYGYTTSDSPPAVQ
jgi:LPS-assembly protein